MKSLRYLNILVTTILMFVTHLMVYAQNKDSNLPTKVVNTFTVMVDQLQPENRHYHVGYPPGLTGRDTLYEIPAFDIPGVSNQNRPSALAKAIGFVIERSAGKNLEYLAVDQYTVVVRLKVHREWGKVERSVLQILSKRLKGKVQVARREQIPRYRYDPPRSYWVLGGSSLHWYTPVDRRVSAYEKEEARQHRIDYDLTKMSLGKIPDASSEDYGIGSAKRTNSGWLVERVRNLPGIESVGIIDGQLYAWVNKAFDKTAVAKQVPPILKQARVRFAASGRKA